MITYNELDGTEVAHVLQNRFQQVLLSVPYFQKHLTMPRVRVTLQVKLEFWADQPNPELVPLNDKFDVVVQREAGIADTITAESVDCAAPIPGGHPPDQIREMHGLPISKPAYGAREIGGQLAITDRYEPLEGREVEDTPGLKINRTGSGVIDGMPTSANATVAKIDQGPAGLRSGQMRRDSWNFSKGGGR